MYRFLTILWLFLGVYTEGVAQGCPCDRRRDSIALLELYKATDGARWTNYAQTAIQPWDITRPLEQWGSSIGFINGCVSSLNLANRFPQDKFYTLPDSFYNLCGLRGLELSGNKIAKVFSPRIGQLTQLQNLIYNSYTSYGIWANQTLPIEMDKLTELTELWLANTGVKGNPPLNRYKKLTQLRLIDNKFTGRVASVDSAFNTASPAFYIITNHFDSLPFFACLKKRGAGLGFDYNNLTFDDLLYYAPPNDSFYSEFRYAPQYAIFKDTIYRVTTGSRLVIDLNIDKGVPDNLYRWFKKINGNWVVFDSTNVSRYVFNWILAEDGGEYKCEVTNPRLPLLTLKTFNDYAPNGLQAIQINALGDIPRDTPHVAICKGQTYRLPSGRFVSLAGTYIDTLKDGRRRDSIIVTTLLAVNTLPTVRCNLSATRYCANGTTVALSGLPSGGQFHIDNQSVTQLNPTNFQTGQHQLTYTFVDANGCSSKDSVLFDILDTSRYDLSKTELCPEYNIIVNGIRYDINKPIGTEILRGQNKNGCDSIVNIRLSFLQKPTAQNDPLDLPNDHPFIEIDPLINDNFRPNPLFRRLDSPKYGQLDSLPNNHFRYTRLPFLTGDISFRYAICDRICPSVCDTATVTIHINDFEARNKIGITPSNRDGINDALVFDLLENDPQRFGNAKLLIFNLLGQVIYQQQPYENKWLGTFQNGQDPVPKGAYLFLLILNDKNKDREQICGSVTVISND